MVVVVVVALAAVSVMKIRFIDAREEDLEVVLAVAEAAVAGCYSSGLAIRLWCRRGRFLWMWRCQILRLREHDGK